MWLTGCGLLSFSPSSLAVLRPVQLPGHLCLETLPKYGGTEGTHLLPTQCQCLFSEEKHNYKIKVMQVLVILYSRYSLMQKKDFKNAH